MNVGSPTALRRRSSCGPELVIAGRDWAVRSVAAIALPAKPCETRLAHIFVTFPAISSLGQGVCDPDPLQHRDRGLNTTVHHHRTWTCLKIVGLLWPSATTAMCCVFCLSLAETPPVRTTLLTIFSPRAQTFCRRLLPMTLVQNHLLRGPRCTRLRFSQTSPLNVTCARARQIQLLKRTPHNRTSCGFE